jgi:YidC/Oxa1 family membrane protein insertase
MQPKIKAIQAKYKGDRQRQNEEMMKLYKEHGYNPLSGCLPMLLQLPVLICLFAVLRMPGGLAHIPADSALHEAVVTQHTYFLGTNLLCSASHSGSDYVVPVVKGQPDEIPVLHCGTTPLSRVPYFVLALLMIGTTFFQQRQMTRASPSGAGNSQQQTIMKVMPLLFGVWGYFFPAGLVVYWTTTNAIQIGQQWFLLHRKGAPFAPQKDEDGPNGAATTKPTTKPKSSGKAPQKGKAAPMRGSSAPAESGPKRPPGGVVPRRGSGSGSSGNGRSSGGGGGRSGGNGSGSGTPKSGSTGGSGSGRQQSGGGGNGGSRRKRPKR